MRQWFKRLVWGVYVWEYGLIHEDWEKPSPQISLCRLSWSLVLLSIAALIILALWAFLIVVVNLLIIPITWLLGFSPNYKWVFFSEDQTSFLHSEGFYSHKTYYKLNKRFAPWQIAVPLVLVAVVAFGIQQGFLLSVVQEYAVIAAALIVGTIAVIALLVALVWSIVSIVRKVSCPVPLDFSDVVKEQTEEPVSV